MTGILQGRVALVTGAARAKGLGAAMGRYFTEQGASVVLTDVLDTEGEATAAGIPGASYLHLDVTSEPEWDRLIERMVAEHGRLDIAVNNAGVVGAARLVNLVSEEWHRVIAINQTGVFLGMRATSREMIRADQGGSIINISSVAGTGAMVGSMAYGASKWAVRGMTKIAAKELGRHQIRVNSIHPGWIDTDMLDLVADEASRDSIAQSTPLGRLGTPDDIAATALHLASDAALFVTGQEFIVDGGWHR